MPTFILSPMFKFQVIFKKSNQRFQSAYHELKGNNKVVVLLVVGYPKGRYIVEVHGSCMRVYNNGVSISTNEQLMCKINGEKMS